VQRQLPIGHNAHEAEVAGYVKDDAEIALDLANERAKQAKEELRMAELRRID